MPFRSVQARSETMPQRNGEPKSRRRAPNDERRHHTMTFKERLRTTFLRKVQKPKAADEIIYGKIVVFGDHGVGKTSVIHRFTNNYFTEQYMPTESNAIFDVTALVEYSDKKTSKDTKPGSLKSVKKGKRESRILSVSNASMQQHEDEEQDKTDLRKFKFQLIDTIADIKNSVPVTYRATIADAQGFLLVCSYEKPDSIDYINNFFDDIADIRHNKEVPVIIVVNKYDLAPSMDVRYFLESVGELADRHKVSWCEVSAASSEGYQVMIELMLNKMDTFNEEEQRENTLSDDYAFVDDVSRYGNNNFKKYNFIF